MGEGCMSIEHVAPKEPGPMDRADVVRFGHLRRKVTGQTVTVVQVTEDFVESENRDTGAWLRQTLDDFLLAHEPLHAPSPWPTYEVKPMAPLPGFGVAALVSVVEEDPAFCDGDEPLELHASPEAIATLQQYLAHLSGGTAWLGRESGGLAAMEDLDITGMPGWGVSLSGATAYGRYPSHWFSLLVGAGEDAPLLALNVRDEGLARQLAVQIASGALKLRQPE